MMTARHSILAIPADLTQSDESSSFASRLAEFTLIGLLCAAVTVPVITFSSSLPWFKIEQLALPLILFAYTWLVLAGIVQPIHVNQLFVVGAAYCICVALSLLQGWLVLGQQTIVSDFYEIPKALLPVAFFTFGLSVRLRETSIQRLLLWFSLAMALVCLYAWAQWLDLGVSHLLNRYYSGGAHDEGSLAHYRRVYSTMGNPNILAQLTTWGFAAFALATLFGVGNRWRSLAMTVACLVTTVMSGSRYGIINTAVVLLLIVVLGWQSRRDRRRLLVALLFLLPLLALIAFGVAYSNQATTERLQTLSNPLTTDSLSERTNRLWRDATDEFLQSPILGHGPAKTIFGDIVTDSEYLDVLKKFGLLGFCVYLFYFLFPVSQLWKGLRSATHLDPAIAESHSGSLWVLRLSLVMATTALLMNIGMSTFYNATLQGFLWMWLGSGVAAARALRHQELMHEILFAPR